MQAGAAEVRLPLEAGLPMMGYGARTGRAAGAHDPLHARALHLASDEGRVLLVQLEVCLLAVPHAEALGDRIARATGLAPHEVWVAATHTHSGPETGVAESLAGGPPPRWMGPVEAAALEAARAAVSGARPARAGLAVARAAIGRNRREAGGAVDEGVVVLRVDVAPSPGAAARPLAVAFVHGTHPTVLGHENLAWSADWPGAAAARVRDAFPGAVPIFLLGAHADVDPRTRGLQDLAMAGQSAGAGYEACATLGHEVGDAVVSAAAGVRLADLAVEARATRVPLGVHGGDDPVEREACLARRAREAALALGLEPDAPLRVSQALSLERVGTEGLAPAALRERLARVRLFVRDRTAARVAGGTRPEVAVRLLRLGPASWLGLPAEATAELGLAWKAGRPAGSALLSNVGGWLRYLPHPDRFADPAAHHHYEVLMSTLEPSASLRLLAAAGALEAA